METGAQRAAARLRAKLAAHPPAIIAPPTRQERRQHARIYAKLKRHDALPKGAQSSRARDAIVRRLNSARAS